MANEEFSNPLPPEHYHETDGNVNEQPLTNADFRKFLTTPKAGGEKTHDDRAKRVSASQSEFDSEDHESAAEKRRKKKSLYAKLKKQEMERQAELQKKYRDRAKERREGKGDYAESDLINTTANYKTVGPSAEADRTSAEKRRQVIQESKYLGGDMAHTHLVKGLDFALLQKVRAEISTKEREDEELDKVLSEDIENTKEEQQQQQKEVVTFKTKMAKNIHRLVFQSQMKLRNELFLPGRMAYVFQVDDEFADTDIPTTLLRSKADCPTLESQTTLSTNDIVINKLTQILSYLRQGAREKHRKKKDRKIKTENDRPHKRPIEADMSIFDDIGEYVPTLKKNRSKPAKNAHSYFEKPKMEEEMVESKQAVAASVKNFVKNVNEKYAGSSQPDQTKETKKQKKESGKGNPLIGTAGASDSYMECYPSAQYNLSGVGDDSDDEADYSKMDQGSKKGPVGRWDFDTQEEYSNYMSQKEAMPKAAFQYGIKMTGGRKTRRTKEQNEKQKLNRELMQINQIIEKRKGGDSNYKKY
uniref:protein Red-like n=1 Tax=Styela clava TaxID=7725 RepID=UPI00193A2301|nr:protein Red-like [Styela clava]